ncbi:MAG: thiamine pyrophosphate-dependent dehydrogenase E1 component subunit alpha [Desulfobacterales bacterium]|nr:thiamine pyrophosphate-dependent dehydrogenase E1 component subunit alpha [Desulfobacterales bacterium]
MSNIDLNKRLYEKIYLIRMVEEKIREIYPSDAMKTPVHLSLGEESIVAGVCHALSQADQVFGTYRSHAVYLAKGGNLDAFFAELYGKESGIAKGKAGSMHISCPEVGFMASSAVVASIIPVALGSAFSASYKKEDRISAVFFGDGATEEGVFWETLNTASLMNLPILFVCENNELAIHAKINDRQSYTISEAVKPFGISVFTTETTDPESIWNIAKEAICAIKETGKPSFLHLYYHRYLEHVGINEDYNAGYRCKEDYADWYAMDPVKIQRKKLVDIGVDEKEIEVIESVVNKMINESIRNAEYAAFPDACELLKDVYS